MPNSSWLWPNIKISVFRVTGLKILGRVGTHIFFSYFFLDFFLCISPLKMYKILFFLKNLEKNLGFTVN